MLYVPAGRRSKRYSPFASVTVWPIVAPAASLSWTPTLGTPGSPASWMPLWLPSIQTRSPIAAGFQKPKS